MTKLQELIALFDKPVIRIDDRGLTKDFLCVLDSQKEMHVISIISGCSWSFKTADTNFSITKNIREIGRVISSDTKNVRKVHSIAAIAETLLLESTPFFVTEVDNKKALLNLHKWVLAPLPNLPTKNLVDCNLQVRCELNLEEINQFLSEPEVK